MDQEHEDFADNDLPPSRIPSGSRLLFYALAVLTLFLFVGLPLIAKFLAAYVMQWN